MRGGQDSIFQVEVAPAVLGESVEPFAEKMVWVVAADVFAGGSARDVDPGWGKFGEVFLVVPDWNFSFTRGGDPGPFSLVSAERILVHSLLVASSR